MPGRNVEPERLSWRVRPPRRPDRHPWQLCPILSFTLVSVLQMFQGSAAGSVNAELLQSFQTFLAAAAILGCCLAVAAAVIADNYNASALELGGMVVLGAVFFAYAITITLTRDHFWTISAWGWATGLVVASSWRGVQIYVDLRNWQKGKP